MAEIVLFHHVLGLTPGIGAFADELRAAGHVVHTPDLLDGHTFPTLDEGMAYARTVGFETILDRGVAAAEVLGPELVYAGFSMGVMPAQKLAQTREGASGALFFDSCLPVTEFGDRWPKGVPVQVHGMEADPMFAGEETSMRRGTWSTPPSRQSCSSTPATCTSSPTLLCRRLTGWRPS